MSSTVKTPTVKAPTAEASADIRRFRRMARDLLGLIRAENAVLACDGQLTLEALYLHKMAMLRDLDDSAQTMADLMRDDNTPQTRSMQLLVHDLQALREALSENTTQHLQSALIDAEGKVSSPWH